MLSNIVSLISATDFLIKDLERLVAQSEDRYQYIYSNILVLRTCGLIEDALLLTLEEYARQRSQPAITKFVAKRIRYMNSFDSEKIMGILTEFDDEWWLKVQRSAGQQCIESIDSVKAIRDKVAHGKHNGTGFVTVRQYYNDVKRFPQSLHDVILK